MMKIKKLLSVVSLVFMYTNIVVTQPTSKVKVEKKDTKHHSNSDNARSEVLTKVDLESKSASLPEKTVSKKESTQEIVLPDTLKLDGVVNNEIVPLNRHEIDMVNYFCKPIEFTPEGIANYFKYVYNHPEYVYYLPYNLSHMIQFLKYGVESGQNEAFASSVIKMFLQKMKAAPYVEAESFASFMPEFVKIMKPYLEKKESNFLQEMQIVLKNKLSELFARYFSVFQKNPDAFMNSVAEQIAKQTNQSINKQHIEVEQLKKDVVRFFEICANKLVWSSKDDIACWYNCNRLAHECQICLENGVICDSNALDDMCWSIIHRFCYFVDLSKDNLSKDFYGKILHDLQTKPLLLVALEEQEDLMMKKKDYLICKMKSCRDICSSLQPIS
jgi:hypothetical protein